MISVIVSSYNEQNFRKFEKNLALTIGLDYELIKIDNPGRFGICEAYNLGIQQSKFPFLCFAHDDIEIHTKNWGFNLLKHFNSNENLGLIGIAGSSYKSWTPSGWPAFNKGSNFMYKNLIQSERKKGVVGKLEKLNFKGNVIEKVVVLDGCFMCTTKAIAEEVGFDQEIFKGYHCYDIDFSLAVGKNYEIAVVYDILLEHYSNGDYNKEWLKDTLALSNKWDFVLPKSTYAVSREQVAEIEFRAFIFLFKTSLRFKSFRFKVYKNIFSAKFIKFIGIAKWLELHLRTVKYVSSIKNIFK